MHLFQTSVPCSCSRQSISVPALFQTSVPCSCSRQSISVLALFHAAVPDFSSVQLFQTKVFPFQLSSRLPFHAAVPDKVFPFQLCSRLPFHAAVPDKVDPFQLCSMHLFPTSVQCSCFRHKYFRSSSLPDFFKFPCSCSKHSLSVPALFHAAVTDFRSMQLLQTKYSIYIIGTHFGSRSVPCICSRLPFHAAFPFPIPFDSVFYSIPCSAL